MKITDGKAFPVGPSEEYAGGVERMLGRLEKPRSRPRATSSNAGKRTTQVDATAGSPSAYAAAAASLGKLDVSPADALLNAQLVAALKLRRRRLQEGRDRGPREGPRRLQDARAARALAAGKDIDATRSAASATPATSCRRPRPRPPVVHQAADAEEGPKAKKPTTTPGTPAAPAAPTTGTARRHGTTAGTTGGGRPRRRPAAARPAARTTAAARRRRRRRGGGTTAAADDGGGRRRPTGGGGGGGSPAAATRGGRAVPAARRRRHASTRRRTRDRRPRPTSRQLAGLVEPQLVAAAVLLGGAFDVGDPLAALRRVLAEVGVAAGDRLALDGERLVDEPLGLQLGLLADSPCRRPGSRCRRASGRSRRESASP